MYEHNIQSETDNGAHTAVGVGMGVHAHNDFTQLTAKTCQRFPLVT